MAATPAVKDQPVILHLTPLAVIGGCEMNCLRLIEGQPGCRHEVLVFDEPGAMTERWAEAGARVHHLGAWRDGNRRFRAALKDWGRSHEVPAGVIYWSSSRLPTVIAALDLWSINWAVHLGNPLVADVKSCVRRFVQEWVYGIPSNVRLVACSNHVAASHHGGSYFRRFPITTVYNPVSAVFDRPRTVRALPAGSAPRLGMVARLDVIKDHVTLIRALAAMRPVRADVVLEFAGSGELRSVLEQEAVRLGVADQLRFLGLVADVPSLIANWDVYVHSTTASEGMGIAVAEAMMGGLPCVVTNLPVMREVCGLDGGVYAPAGDGAGWSRILLEVIANRDRRVALGQAARQRARAMFATPAVAARYLDLVAPQPENAFA